MSESRLMAMLSAMLQAGCLRNTVHWQQANISRHTSWMLRSALAGAHAARLAAPCSHALLAIAQACVLAAEVCLTVAGGGPRARAAAP